MKVKSNRTTRKTGTPCCDDHIWYKAGRRLEPENQHCFKCLAEFNAVIFRRKKTMIERGVVQYKKSTCVVCQKNGKIIFREGKCFECSSLFSKIDDRESNAFDIRQEMMLDYDQPLSQKNEDSVCIWNDGFSYQRFNREIQNAIQGSYDEVIVSD